MSAKKLKAPITFETSATIFERSKKREVIITLEPSGFIGLRLKGTARTYDLDLAACYHAAVKREVSRAPRRSKR